MNKFTRLTATACPLDIANLNTDQIIPARFLKRARASGFGEALLHDLRFDAQGRARPDFPLNRPAWRGARIIVGGRNFGCGSSREHAPWALVDYGIRAVVSTRIADIFRSNCLKNGLIPIVLDAASHARLLAAPGTEVAVDLESQTISLPGGGTASFPIDAFSRYCLMNGVDELGFLLSQDAAITGFEGAR